jgi:peroxiredoxin
VTQQAPEAAQDVELESPSLAVKVGEPVPSIGLRASDGYLLNLRTFVSKQPAAFVFFAGPTAQGAQGRRGTRLAESLAGGLRRLTANGIAVVGVTCDNERQQTDWIAEHHIPFLLFSDERRSAVNRLGVPLTNAGGNYNVARPFALIIGRDGLIGAIISDPEPEYAADIVLAAVRRAEGRDEDDVEPAARAPA